MKNVDKKIKEIQQKPTELQIKTANKEEKLEYLLENKKEQDVHSELRGTLDKE